MKYGDTDKWVFFSGKFFGWLLGQRFVAWRIQSVAKRTIAQHDRGSQRLVRKERLAQAAKQIEHDLNHALTVPKNHPKSTRGELIYTYDGARYPRTDWGSDVWAELKAIPDETPAEIGS